MATDDDLDKLLDSALDDFIKLDLNSSQRSDVHDDVERTDLQQPATAESSSSAAPVQGLGLGLPELKDRRKGKQRLRSGRPAPAPAPKGAHAAEALEMLMQQTRETVKGIETAAGSREGEIDEAMVEEFVKQFQQATGSESMESIVETMMQQLLSKEILQEPMKEIGEKYPKWLEEHKNGLSTEDYNRYHHQYQLILKLNEVYEKEPDNFQKVVDLMQKMQECGQPPNEIVQELAPDLDLNNLAQLSPELLSETSSNCCVM